MNDQDWFKTAVFYEVLVRSFADSDGNGIGDLAGLTGKLDYLADLGVNCLWLPPFFPSPLRDGGYDVADYYGVQPELGTLDDMRTLLDAAHARGMRVITDFVMNHTSDAHPWFQASRNDPTGPYGDFYVWRDAPDEYLDARVIFIDSISSNWSFDEVRGQYFWHRFYSFQPDLNFENPRVLEEMLKAFRFWLDLGVDGFRLDAVPYLIEADGTNCENLPGTHDILKRVRTMVDAEYPGRILLCEANQWPSDVIEYFGDGDECQMAFHFPVMPRLYMGLRQGSRQCISQILADTPPIPAGCQWGTFLRNHDELTLEMVTEDERQYMWREYAPDPRMKCNLGIRRRLAPLVDNDPRRIKLLHALLLALPGSPCLYYGDEIGMGDNIWLNDRDGVRTPMQWDASPGAGFSTGEAADFPYPLLDDPVYGPAAINVAAQQADPDSLFNWLRGILAVRAGVPAMSLGGFVDLGGPDEVFSFVRSHDGVTVVAVNNLTDAAASVSLDLAAWAPTSTVELAGPAERVLDGSRLTVTLPPYGHAWIEVR
jgi:maltose alpha-D-glucosyltransferase / alpha-amylase